MSSPLTLSIVTPSLNGRATIEQCIESVLQQRGSGTDFLLQYIVVDGGSEDGSLEAIDSYRDRLHEVIVGQDNGPYDAVRRGFEAATGDVLAWLNADDAFCPWACQTVAAIFSDVTDCQWLTTRRPAVLSADGRLASVHPRIGYSSETLLRGAHHPQSPERLAYVQQESTFFRRDLWQRSGGHFDAAYPLAGDFELWLRMAKLASIDNVDVPLGMFRYHPGQRSADLEAYHREAAEALRNTAGVDAATRRRRADRFVAKLWRRIAKNIEPSFSVIERTPLDDANAKWVRHHESA